jgi:hypothetical protein
MTNFICMECGTQFEQTIALPLRCPICEDERQYVRHDGQQWTTLNELRGRTATSSKMKPRSFTGDIIQVVADRPTS